MAGRWIQAEARGMLAGAAIIFFAYIGFDSVSTHTEEARNPQRDVPIGIITSLIVCTFLYIAVVAVLTGMVKFDQLDINAPVSDAFKQKVSAGRRASSPPRAWRHHFRPAGDDAQRSRVFLAMARTACSQEHIRVVHPKFRTPWKSTILVGFFVSLLAGFSHRLAPAPHEHRTLLAFVIVCAAVLIMRKKYPDTERLSAVPGSRSCPSWHPHLPAADVLPARGQLVAAHRVAGARFGIYFLYGRKHSVMRATWRGGTRTAPERG